MGVVNRCQEPDQVNHHPIRSDKPVTYNSNFRLELPAPTVQHWLGVAVGLFATFNNQFHRSLEGDIAIEVRGEWAVQRVVGVLAVDDWRHALEAFNDLGLIDYTVAQPVDDVLAGDWVQLRIPAELLGERIHVELAASNRSLGMPVKLLSGSLHYEFIEHGAVAPLQMWGEVPQLALEPPYYLSMPNSQIKDDEAFIWQIWIPLDEKAQYLEMHIWYPHQILPASEGDKGYRYQIKVDEDGTLDDNENRIVGSDMKTLPIDRLGGRDNVTPLLIFK